MSRRRRRRAAKRRTPALIIISLIVIFALAAVAGDLISRRLPTKELANLEELYGSEEGYATMIANHERIEQKAIWTLDHAYLPYEVVCSELNGGFYWDPLEEKLMYTLPEEVVSVDSEAAYDGAPVFLQQDDTVYISLAYVEQYTNIRAEHFESPNRIVLQTEWGTEKVAVLKGETPVRVKGGIKSKIVTVRPAGETVTILEELENWSKVQTADGFQGYLENDDLKDVQEITTEGPYEEPVYTTHQVDYRVRMLWHQVFGNSGLEAFREFLANHPGTPVTTVSPTWLSLTSEEGTLESYVSKEYVDLAHQAGIDVWVTLENVNHQVNIEEMLLSTSRRGAMISAALAEVAACGAEGLNLDFERIPESAGEAYVQLVREMSVACRLAGIVFSVDNLPPSGWASYYNVKEQGKMVDYVVIMAYDEHYAGSDPGSTSSLPYVQQSMIDTLNRVPADKVICGLPFYTRLWKDSPEGLTSEACSMPQSTAFVAEHGGELKWLDDVSQNYAKIKEGETVYQIWLEDAASLQAKLQLVQTYEIAGTAYWKLGMQSEDVWELIGNYQ